MQPIDLYLEQARGEEATGHVVEAFMLYRHAFECNPWHAPTVEALARLAVAQGQYQAALPLCRSALALDPGRPESWQLLTENLATLNDDEQAERSEQLAEKSAAELLPLRIDSLRNFVREGRMEAAQYLLQKIMDLNPNHPDLPQLQQLLASH